MLPAAPQQSALTTARGGGGAGGVIQPREPLDAEGGKNHPVSDGIHFDFKCKYRREYDTLSGGNHMEPSPPSNYSEGYPNTGTCSTLSLFSSTLC